MKDEQGRTHPFGGLEVFRAVDARIDDGTDHEHVRHAIEDRLAIDSFVLGLQVVGCDLANLVADRRLPDVALDEGQQGPQSDPSTCAIAGEDDLFPCVPRVLPQVGEKLETRRDARCTGCERREGVDWKDNVAF